MAKQTFFLSGRPRQYMLDTPPGRLADADAQAPEAFAHLRHDVGDAVVPCRAAALLETYHAREKIQLVVSDQNFLHGHFIERSQTAHRRAAFVHERRRLQQPQLLGAHAHPRHFALVFGFMTKNAAMTAGYLLHEPETAVVPRAGILVAGISEPGDELERLPRHCAYFLPPS